MKRPGIGYITQAPPPTAAFTLAHTAALTTSGTHAPQRAYGGSEERSTPPSRRSRTWFDSLPCLPCPTQSPARAACCPLSWTLCPSDRYRTISYPSRGACRPRSWFRYSSARFHTTMSLARVPCRPHSWLRHSSSRSHTTKSTARAACLLWYFLPSSSARSHTTMSSARVPCRPRSLLHTSSARSHTTCHQPVLLAVLVVDLNSFCPFSYH